MANYQLELTGAEINQRLKNIGKETDEQSPSGSIYARIAQNQDDITELGAEVAANTEAIDKNKTSVEKLRTQMNTFAENVDTLIDGVEGKANTNSDNIDKINEKLDTDVVSDVATTRNPTSVYIKQTKRNIKTGATNTSTVYLMGASETNAGVMTADDKNTLSLLENRVTDVETATADHNDLIAENHSGLINVADVDDQCFFSVYNKQDISFTNKANAEVAFKLYRWTGKRYVEYILWDVSQKVDYTIFSGQFRLFIRLNAQNAMELGEFVYRHATKRKKWGIVAFDTDSGLPLTSMFEFAVANQSVLSISDLHEGAPKVEWMLVKTNGHRNTPRKEETRLAYYYNSEYWQTVGDKSLGFCFESILNKENQKILKRFPCSGDIVRRGNNKTAAEGNILCVDRKADGTFEMTWNEGKKVYSMAFSKYTYDLKTGEELDGGALNSNKRTGMRITRAATLICGDITNQTKGGTLRDLYIQAGAKYNKSTGYYELNGLTDITEEEMWAIWQDDLRRWYKKGRTNLTNNIAQKGNSGGYNGGIDICCLCSDNQALTKFNLGYPCYAHYLDNAFSNCPNLREIDTRYSIVPFGATSIGPNIFRGCTKLQEVRFDNKYINASTNLSFKDSPFISKASVLTAITTTRTSNKQLNLTITLHPDAYARLKDDVDILAALEEKNGVVTLVSA